jgi:hypothetical protein
MLTSAPRGGSRKRQELVQREAAQLVQREVAGRARESRAGRQRTRQAEERALRKELEAERPPNSYMRFLAATRPQLLADGQAIYAAVLEKAVAEGDAAKQMEVKWAVQARLERGLALVPVGTLLRAMRGWTSDAHHSLASSNRRVGRAGRRWQSRRGEVGGDGRGGAATVRRGRAPGGASRDTRECLHRPLDLTRVAWITLCAPRQVAAREGEIQWRVQEALAASDGPPSALGTRPLRYVQ